MVVHFILYFKNCFQLCIHYSSKIVFKILVNLKMLPFKLINKKNKKKILKKLLILDGRTQGTKLVRPWVLVMVHFYQAWMWSEPMRYWRRIVLHSNGKKAMYCLLITVKLYIRGGRLWHHVAYSLRCFNDKTV